MVRFQYIVESTSGDKTRVFKFNGAEKKQQALEYARVIGIKDDNVTVKEIEYLNGVLRSQRIIYESSE